MPQLGILHVATVGGTRFKIERHSVEPSGLVVGEVKEIAAEPRVALHAGAAAAGEAARADRDARRAGRTSPPIRDYGDASWVGYRLAEFLPLPLPIKQSMLEINDAGVRLTVLQKFLAEQGVI